MYEINFKKQEEKRLYTTSIIPAEQRIKEFKQVAMNNSRLKENKVSRKNASFLSKLVG